MKLTGVLLVILLTFAACGETGDAPAGGSATPASDAVAFTVRGELVLSDQSVLQYNEGASCAGTQGYDDIQGGAQVLVRDSEGAQVAVGRLEQGEPDSPTVCRFEFTVADVPPGDPDLFSVEVSNRGQVSFTQSEAETGLTLSLG